MSFQIFKTKKRLIRIVMYIFKIMINTYIKKLDYSKTITSLRGISVLGVLLYHSKYSYFEGGFLGVDVFFVISGYLIGNIIFSQFSINEFSFKVFYKRRIRRLIPSLIFTLFFTYLISYFIFLPGDFEIFEDSVIYTLFFIGNIFFWKTNDYFSPSTDISPLSHLWSLAIEEQFYLLFPLFIVVLLKNSFIRKNIGIIVFFSALLSFVYSISNFYHLPIECPSTNCIEITTFYWLHTRGWEILVGVALNFFTPQKIFFEKKTFNIGLLLIIFSFIFVDHNLKHPGFVTLPVILGTVLTIIYSSKNDDNYLSKSKLLYFLGKISYSLYLIHFPIFVVRNYFGYKTYVGSGFDILPIFLIGISILISYLMWLYIETPFRDSNIINDKKLLLTLSPLVVFIVITVSTNIIPNKNLNPEYEKFDFTTNFDIKKECFFEKVPENMLAIDHCLAPKQNVENVLVLGSSIAKNIYRGLTTIDQNTYHFDIVVVTGCPPLLEKFDIDIENFDEKKCEIIYQQIIKNLQSKKYSKIIISYQWGELISKDLDSTESLFDNTINNILQNVPKERLTLIGPPVVWQNRVDVIALRAVNFQENINQFNNLYLNEKIFSYELNFVQKVENLNIDYFSIVNYLCVKDKCKLYEKINETYYFTSKDFIHISDYFSAKIAVDLFQKLEN